MPMERGKYQAMLDRETWDYIHDVERWFPPDILDRPVDEQRKVYDAMCRAFHADRPSGVRAMDIAIPSADGPVRMRRYFIPDGSSSVVVLYFHGGGFTFGGLDSHDDICAEICAGAGLAVISVDYRLAPESLHPASFRDAVAAYRWLGDQDVAILLCGESAGGNLAAAVAHAARGDRHLLGQVLIYPDLGGQAGSGSYLEHAHAPLLSLADLAVYRSIRTGGVMNHQDPTLWPLQDSDFSRLPPTVVVTAECDPLSDDGRNYTGRLTAAGCRAYWRNEPRLTHSFLRSRRTVRRAQAAFEAILADTSALAKGSWPY
ncbi:alpha/beta hydrolase [Nitratireductor sp. ZSWI3]|uniref:alpha/beta hydrolase n=1 Tax=Nitratireductor sp. ZSWI3 TaxID=2966359 RepID=UPI00214FDCC4|nr:alpha/beta hydrolase [Nitratireductor sp. ZSWI3]MCR4265049.1 alpha/beta hydrolase [Nitratireductor sp. ZSWI3]